MVGARYHASRAAVIIAARRTASPRDL